MRPVAAFGSPPFSCFVDPGGTVLSPLEAAHIAFLADPVPLVARPCAILPVTSTVAPVQCPIPLDIQRVLYAFHGVFPDEIPLGLPPSRPTDHRVYLVPDAVPPSH